MSASGHINFFSQGTYPLRGSLRVPPDKSISHRALIFSALASGTSTISGLLDSEDIRCTMRILQALGIRLEPQEAEWNGSDSLVVHGMGGEFRAPSERLDCGNSGTTMRLMLGILAGCPFEAELCGDSSLDRRPMKRVMDPLSLMGAKCHEYHENGRRILCIQGHRPLNFLDITLNVASAQVKTCLWLAALVGKSEIVLREKGPSRDHSERMLHAMGVSLRGSYPDWTLKSGKPLLAQNWQIPGDFSSAAFWLVAASVIPDSDLLLHNVGFNPTRTGLFTIMQRMGGDFQVESEREVQGEQVVDIRVRHRALRGAVVDADEVALAIDEIPIFSLAARCSVGESIVSGAGELRVKESDRISSLLLGYASMGIFFHEKPDGWEVVGPQEASAAELESHGDHRLAMTFILNALTAEGWWNIRGVESIATSYPQFFEHLEEVTGLSLLPGAL